MPKHQSIAENVGLNPDGNFWTSRLALHTSFRLETATADTMAQGGVILSEILMLLVVMDVFLAWLQTDERHWLRRGSHFLVAPLLLGPRIALSRVPTAGWDISPLVLVVVLTVFRVWWSSV